MGSWEAAGRRAGFVPSVADDAQSWAIMRGRVSDRSTVILGTSRAQADIDPQAWADEVGSDAPLSLAIAGGSVLPVLEDISRMESFRGLVLVDFVPRIEFDATRHREQITLEYLNVYEDVRRSPGRFAEAHLRWAGPGLLVSKNASLSPRRVLGSLAAVIAGDRPLGQALPSPPYFFIRQDRYMSLDFSRVDVSERIDAIIGQITVEGRPAVGGEVIEVLQRVTRSVRRIEERGGRVVLLHLPHANAVRALEERQYPRDRYWARLEALPVGEKFYTGDLPSLGGFDCPDGSHLDTRDSAAFTRALARAVTDSGPRGRTSS
ncbi:MAG TPA: hypothetical protein VLA09_08980 [Longimicrobiales bacterium]|nr:hypothetical protein [Longimicrobiales bacterium]